MSWRVEVRQGDRENICTLVEVDAKQLMEKGEDWSSYGGITDGVGNLLEDLDHERLALASALGLSVRSVFDHHLHSFGVEAEPVGRMAQKIALARPLVKGPKSLNSRFVTEDVPFGLYPLVELGRAVGVPMLLHESGIALFSALYRRDFVRENDVMPRVEVGALVKAHHTAAPVVAEG